MYEFNVVIITDPGVENASNHIDFIDQKYVLTTYPRVLSVCVNRHVYVQLYKHHSRAGFLIKRVGEKYRKNSFPSPH